MAPEGHWGTPWCWNSNDVAQSVQTINVNSIKSVTGHILKSRKKWLFQTHWHHHAPLKSPSSCDPSSGEFWMPHDERCLHLAPCSLHIFGVLKNALKSRMFALVINVQEAVAVVQWFLYSGNSLQMGYADSCNGGGVCLCKCLWWFVLTYNTLAPEHSLRFSFACLKVNNCSNVGYSWKRSIVVDIVGIIIQY